MSVVLLVPDLILSIVCGHVLFLFLVVFFVVVYCDNSSAIDISKGSTF